MFENGVPFDYIEPGLALIGTIASWFNGGEYVFYIPRGCGWRGNDIVALLKGAGIPVHGKALIRGHFRIGVHAEDEFAAKEILASSGVPFGR